MLRNSGYKDIALISIDLDGTALDCQNADQTYSMSSKTIQAINKISLTKNIIIATGRDYSSTKKYFKVFPKLDFLITDNGANIYHRISGHIFSNDLDVKTIKKIFQLIPKDKLSIRFSGQRIIYSNNDFVNNLAKKWNFEVVKIGSMKNSASSKIMLFFDKRASMLKFVEILKHNNISVNVFINMQNNFIEVSNIKASKGIALNFVTKQLGLNKNNVIHIGDSNNDLSAKDYVGLLVGMGNADKDFKQECHLVIGKDVESGLAVFLNKF